MAIPTWRAVCGDLLDVRADVLVCSANVFLTLSGGVGGELLLRYGDAVALPLAEHLEQAGRRWVPRGTLVVTRPEGVPYRAVLHAVAVDGAYDSTPAVVKDLLRRALSEAAALGAVRVALPALATGFGHLTKDGFLEAIDAVRSEAFGSVAQVVIAHTDASVVERMRERVESRP